MSVPLSFAFLVLIGTIWFSPAVNANKQASIRSRTVVYNAKLNISVYSELYKCTTCILTVLLLSLVGSGCADHFALLSTDDTRLDTL